MQTLPESQKYKSFQKRRNARRFFVQGLYVQEQTQVTLTTALDDVALLTSPEVKVDQSLIRQMRQHYLAHKENLIESVVSHLRYPLDRFALIDQVLILSAACELQACPHTDAKVIINEYLEVCKEMSCPSSKGKINAILDTLSSNLPREVFADLA